MFMSMLSYCAEIAGHSSHALIKKMKKKKKRKKTAMKHLGPK